MLEPEAADQWEIAQERLLLGRVLGEGAFGVVQRGRLQQADSDWAVDVAVKMLRGDYSNLHASRISRC